MRIEFENWWVKCDSFTPFSMYCTWDYFATQDGKLMKCNLLRLELLNFELDILWGFKDYE